MQYSNELYHHGILGQKWGIRRYQNKDGSLTKAGIKRYGTVANFNKVKKAEAKKPEAKKEATKEASTPNSTSLAKGSYIQVASVSKLDTNSALIKKIIASGYKYKTHKVVVNGNEVIKILIGPFGADLESNMQKIRQDISSGAFVYRVK